LKIKLNNTCLPVGRFADGEKTEDRTSQKAKTAIYIVKVGILVISIFQPDPIYIIAGFIAGVIASGMGRGMLAGRWTPWRSR